MRPTENEGRPTPHGGGNGIRGEGVLGLISELGDLLLDGLSSGMSESV